MQYRKRKLRGNIDLRAKAVDVLYKKMNFYSDNAIILAGEICDRLKDSNAPPKYLYDLHKSMMRFDELAIECASKLAPYQSSKLSSVDIKKEVIHRYVIAAPSALKSNKEWMQQVRDTALPPPKLIRKIEKSDAVIDIEPDYELENLNVP